MAANLTEKPKRIHLLGQGRHEEGVAAGAITPGMLVALNSAAKLIAHGVAAGHAERAFALEDALQGKTIDDAYAADDRVSYVMAGPGDVVYAWLAAGENVTPADTLTSNGDGMLKEGASTDVRVAVPLESLDLSDSAAVDTRIRVRLL